MDLYEVVKTAFLRAISILASARPDLALRLLSQFSPALNKRGMAPVVSLFLGLATVIIVALVSVLLSGVVSGQMTTLFDADHFNVTTTWTSIATNIESIISSAYSIGGLGILIFAFMVILAILGVGMATRR